VQVIAKLRHSTPDPAELHRHLEQLLDLSAGSMTHHAGFLSISAPDISQASELARKLRLSPYVEAAYVKPGDQLP
jgi:hypothetical protein